MNRTFSIKILTIIVRTRKVGKNVTETETYFVNTVWEGIHVGSILKILKATEKERFEKEKSGIHV